MSFFGLFASKGPTEKAISKQKKRVREQYAQTEYRQEAMEKLLSWDTDESLNAVLERFNVVVQSPHYDEEEKLWLCEELKKTGDRGKEAIIRFISRSNEVTYAILALEKVSDSHEEYVGLLIKSLKKRSPEDHRSLQAKKEIIKALADDVTPENITEILPYLNDHNDDVQCTVADMIVSSKAEKYYGNLLEVAYEDQRSGRVMRHAALLVSELGLTVNPNRTLTPEVAEDFAVRSDKFKPLR